MYGRLCSAVAVQARTTLSASVPRLRRAYPTMRRSWHAGRQKGSEATRAAASLQILQNVESARRRDCGAGRGWWTSSGKVKFMKTGKRDADPGECVVEHPKDPNRGPGHADVGATRAQNLPHAAGRLSRAARSGREMTWKTWRLCLRAWMCLKPGCEHGPDDRRADGFDQTGQSNTDDQLARIRVNGACSLLDGG